MSFLIDEQTLSDLNVFTESNYTFSLYSLFKNCKTIGGREKIRDLMAKPTNDIQLLQTRVAGLEYLANADFNFEIENAQLDLILHYLAQGKPLLRGNPIDSLLVHLKNKLKDTQEYYMIRLGILNIRNLLMACENFVQFVSNNTDSPAYLIALSQKLQAIASITSLKSILVTKRKNLSFYEFSRIDALIRLEKLKIYEFLDLVYELDAMENIAAASKNNRFCFPTYLPNGSKYPLTVTGLYHPAFQKPTSNDLVMKASNQLIFMTGSNMAGKSSFLKALGIATYLAHIGFPVPATTLNIEVFDGLTTSINLPDELEQGLSHYLSEVKRVKSIVSHLAEGKKMVVVLDELFRGTNARDATEATKLVIDGFSKISGSIFFISSHITELTTQIDSNRVRFLHMEHFMQNDKPVFTYLIKEGVSKDGIGMFFLKEEKLSSLFDLAIQKSKARS